MKTTTPAHLSMAAAPAIAPKKASAPMTNRNASSSLRSGLIIA
jgi:hypothetical protein